MSLFRQTVVCCVVVVALGCHEVPEAPPELSVTMSATTAWSGSTVQLVSAGFAALKATPVVYLGPTAVPVSRINDSTVAITLPRAASGALDVWVSAGGGRTYVGTLQLTGYRETHLGPVFSGTPYWLIPGGPPLLLGDGDHGAAIFDLTHNAALQISPDSVQSPDCAINVGPTSAPGTWVFTGSNAAGGCLRPRSWSLGPSYSLTSMDTTGSLWNDEAWWVMAQPGPQRWVLDWNNNLYLINCNGGSGCTSSWRNDGNNVSRILISPKDGQFLMLPAGRHNTTVVYDATRMDTAYTLPWSEGSGAFSPDGDTLYLLGYDSAGVPHLHSVLSSTGQLLSDRSLDSLGFPIVADLDLALDPVRPWLYLSLATSDVYVFGTSQEFLKHVLIIIDRNSWQVVGIAPSDVPLVLPLNGGSQGTVIPSPNDHAVFVILTTLGYRSHGINAVVARFDTP